MKSQRFSALLQDDVIFAHKQILPTDDKEKLSAEITRLRLRILELERHADTDPLVPVYNRRAFMREISRAQSVRKRYDIISSVIFIDLNDFRSVNDRFGHAIGDALLQRIGEMLLTSVRDCDMVARLGGDAFGILLFKASQDIARAKASALTCRIAEQFIDMPTMRVQTSASWGVAPCDADDTPEQVLDRADRSMSVLRAQENLV